MAHTKAHTKLGQSPTRRLGDLLVADGLISPDQLLRALAEQKGTSEKLGSVLLRLNLLTEEQLIGFLSRQYGIPSITLSQLDVESEVLRLVPAAIAKKYEVLPVKRVEGTLTLAMADPTNVFALDDVAFMTNLQVLPVVASQAAIQKATPQPYGMVLITGPTGSGKTTTLYSAIHTINSPDHNIMTAEDPVEYNLKGVNQVQINEGIGRTFAAVLRSFLRQDPDVILVGETRDLETAQISIRAALTGHLVFSTLHTNDCPSTVARLVDMGIPPFLVASALLMLLAQRLGRKVCKDCRETYEVDESTLLPYGHQPTGRGTVTLYRGRGCASCNSTGMKGRVAIYEIMPVTPELRDLILKGAPTSELRRVGQSQGVKTLRQAGLLKALEGVTTIEEVLRVTVAE